MKFLKRKLSILLALGMALSSCAAVNAKSQQTASATPIVEMEEAKPQTKADSSEINKWENPFTDVNKEDWYYSAVEYVVKNKLFLGTQKELFSPNKAVSRAMLITVLYRAEGSPWVDYNISFADVDEKSYYAEAVCWAAGNEIISGYSETEFKPDKDITREELAAIVYRYAVYKKYDVSVGENTNILSYTDFNDISSYAIPAIQYVLGSSFIEGKTESTINPQDIATRAETAVIFERFNSLYGDTLAVDYSDKQNWAYWNEGEDKQADLFIVCPTVDMGETGNFVADITNEKYRNSFTGALNMELGIYKDSAALYAPYYRQATFPIYNMSEEQREKFLDFAYNDIRNAFLYYAEHTNSDRPIILAGFSQGSDMIIRLMKDLFNDEKYSDRLIAAYCIGWKLTKEEVKEYPQLKPAKGESDTGVIVTFNSEAEDITNSLLVGENEKTYAINPLNWKTDSTKADKSENLGACFTNYSGEITEEIPELTGAYIDEKRGALKVMDVSKEDYPGKLFEDGVYHLYDYQFFYRNLQENVKTRLNTYIINKAAK